MRLALMASVVLACAAACTTAEQFRRADGGTNFVIACGAAVGWNICLERANQECPLGFDVLSQTNDGNRKEMTIACDGHPGPPVSPIARAAAACRLRAAEAGGPLTADERQARVQDCMLAGGYAPGSY